MWPLKELYISHLAPWGHAAPVGHHTVSRAPSQAVVPGAHIPGADVPGADVPGADIPDADIPGADVPPRRCPPH